MPNDIRLKPHALDHLKTTRGLTTDQELARALGISAPTLSQIRHHGRGVGPAFIAGAWAAFGIGVDGSPGSIYDIVTGEPPALDQGAAS